MQEGNNARQQVVERIRQSTSILVAVGNSPSVDALAASLGLTLMLNKMNKHTTAVFSGVVPQAIQFLEPGKSFENNVDALRDFIISLDKEKADRLRYKVEDDVVRIFITPYKTSISEKDLQFSQGDFNVDLIIALGVEKREDLDKVIVAHGRILHDATVITVNADNQRSTLGAIDWNDGAASSLCEMIVAMSEVFQQPGILDAQISTALLTGIVANTERFSNPRTSPRVMTMAAQLMAAGANQQLIATNLEQAKAISTPAAAGPMAKQEPSTAPAPMQEESPKAKKQPGELDIVHDKTEPTPAAAPAPKPAEKPAEPALTAQQEKELEAALPVAEVQHNLLPDLKEDLEAATKEQAPEEPKATGDKSVNVTKKDEPAVQDGKKEEDGEGDYISSHGSWKGKRLEPPTLGGTLNATAEEAHDDAEKAEEVDRNQKLLTHPDDAPQQGKSKRSRSRRGKGNGGDATPAAQAAPAAAAAAATPAATPALPAEPVVAPLPPAPEPAVPAVDAPALPPLPPVPAPEQAPAPEPAPAPKPEPAPALPPLPEPPVAPAPLPPAPAPEPVAVPAPEPQAPISELPVNAPIPEPATVPTPAPLPEPAPFAPEPAQEVASTAAAEAAAAAQPAQNTAGDLNSAREAVTAALDAQPFNPAGQPAESVGAQPLPAMPAMPVAEPLSPAALQNLPPAPEPATTPMQPAGDLPPLPPMPPLPPSGTELPPAPELPGLGAPLPPINEPPVTPAAPEAPQTPPANDPKQFKIPGA